MDIIRFKSTFPLPSILMLIFSIYGLYKINYIMIMSIAGFLFLFGFFFWIEKSNYLNIICLENIVEIKSFDFLKLKKETFNLNEIENLYIEEGVGKVPSSFRFVFKNGSIKTYYFNSNFFSNKKKFVSEFIKRLETSHLV